MPAVWSTLSDQIAIWGFLGHKKLQRSPTALPRHHAQLVTRKCHGAPRHWRNCMGAKYLLAEFHCAQGCARKCCAGDASDTRRGDCTTLHHHTKSHAGKLRQRHRSHSRACRRCLEMLRGCWRRPNAWNFARTYTAEACGASCLHLTFLEQLLSLLWPCRKHVSQGGLVKRTTKSACGGRFRGRCAGGRTERTGYSEKELET